MNEEILTYNTPNSGEILQQINRYEYKRLWENSLKKNTKNLFYGITFTVFGVIAFFLGGYIYAAFFLGFSIAVYSYYFSSLADYKKHKKDFFSEIDREITNLRANSKDVIWEFTPTHFSFKNYRAEYKFIWQEITYCILDDKYLYITASSVMNFILDKDNIDEDNLTKTILYLENKSKFKEV
ncbi:hypothetical protein CHRY9390_01953 [Chryseobacterium aquaeductus]|uniref:YcxB-like protein domain-containing protein n=1 Tax=Chryseobacterium aquaeductus TaxID=2675056 RepID=A0A9N8MGT1_9FLAO|nr:hypothetical protein [Chryseobacterium aquaeductus]CAA7331265.1 hypothetical protein CHRY9390_01953 [Chryseobacterium potabilaquae]CAD7809169.1 hypothetical protein CHRY9390_01953 [Chryseobacterium aquaeductus]